MKLCPFCRSETIWIGGWDKNGNPTKISTWFCKQCQIALVDEVEDVTGSTS